MARQRNVWRERERRAALDLLRALDAAGEGAVQLSVRSGRARARHLPVPERLRALLAQLVEAVVDGERVLVLAPEEELTTQQAADQLGVSRPHLVRLLEEGAMPFRLVGTHRRVRADDLDAYRRRERAERMAAVQELAALDEELDLGR